MERAVVTDWNQANPALERGIIAPEFIYAELAAERARAHAKHGATSMESYPVDDLNRLAILTEELGEVAMEFNEARHDDRPVDLTRLRKELLQTAAMATAWADAIEAPAP